MMEIIISKEQAISDSLVKNYFQNLVNRFFKILPMRENGENTLNKYMRSLSNELLGCKCLMPDFATNPSYLTLLSILEYLISNPDCDVNTVKREVFHAISICEKMEKHFSGKEV